MYRTRFFSKTILSCTASDLTCFLVILLFSQQQWNNTRLWVTPFFCQMVLGRSGSSPRTGPPSVQSLYVLAVSVAVSLWLLPPTAQETCRLGPTHDKVFSVVIITVTVWYVVEKKKYRWSEFRRATNVTPNQIFLSLKHAPFLSNHIVCKLMEHDLNNNCYSHVLLWNLISKQEQPTVV